jgi:hypothetical protein
MCVRVHVPSAQFRYDLVLCDVHAMALLTIEWAVQLACLESRDGSRPISPRHIMMRQHVIESVCLGTSDHFQTKSCLEDLIQSAACFPKRQWL